MKLQEIKQYENNAKIHTDDQLLEIATSIKKIGWQQPVKLGKDNVIVVGHGRFQAYQKHCDEMSLDPIWVINYKGETVMGGPSTHKMTKNEERIYRLFDNKINQKTGFLSDAVFDELSLLRDEGEDVSLTGFEESLLNDPKEVSGGTEVSLDDLDDKSKLIFTFGSSKDYLECLEQLGKFKEQYEHETNEEALLVILRQCI